MRLIVVALSNWTRPKLRSSQLLSGVQPNESALTGYDPNNNNCYSQRQTQLALMRPDHNLEIYVNCARESSPRPETWPNAAVDVIRRLAADREDAGRH